MAGYPFAGWLLENDLLGLFVGLAITSMVIVVIVNKIRNKSK